MPEGPARTDVGTSQSDLESNRQAENRQTAQWLFLFIFPPLLLTLVILGALFSRSRTLDGSPGTPAAIPAAIIMTAAICFTYYHVMQCRGERRCNGSYQALREETPDASEEPRHEEGNKSGDGNDGKKPGAQKGQKKGTKNASPATRF